mmetsp:Transcript_88028/g.188894  ORF Transcript_88028/g.188894 Transcript_88028/m.188894 type:complete len:241 (+) Transcript_88028:120-842(+)
MDSKLGQIFLCGQACAIGVIELVQRVVIIVADFLLIIFAMVAIFLDWNHTCDETLPFYGAMCVTLCILDLVWEFVRCSLESSLDRLQTEFLPEGSSCMADGSPFAEGLVGQAHEGSARDLRELGAGGSARVSTGAIGRGVRQEKVMKRKRTADLHFWSTIFTCFVSVVFSFFSAHDEDCAEHAPHLYSYVHAFTYVFIFRLGAIMLWVCCRTVKNYEDAANVNGGMNPPQQVTAMQPLSV